MNPEHAPHSEAGASAGRTRLGRLPRLPLTVWALAATSFLRDVASEMLVHLVPLYLANVLGARTSVIGLIEGLSETTSSLTKIGAGWLSDRLGRRKGLTLAGYGLAALATPLLLVAGNRAELFRLPQPVRCACRYHDLYHHRQKQRGLFGYRQDDGLRE